MNSGILYIVATPIGNLGDITNRAIETLKSVDFVYCEDTRDSSRIMAEFGIKTALKSYHQHSSARDILGILKELEQGRNLAVVTDAGTPGISDPGNLLIQELLKRNPQIKIVPIPGASAVIAALSISGLPTDKFLFLGFPPHKNKRQKFFKELALEKYTVVFYESGHRISKCLANLATVLEPSRPIVVCRELTKKFETIYRGTIAEIISQKIDERGEFVLIIRTIYAK
ncbi:MAG: 16S rRNA (cytidine(1402)-2'-O)-methyltransferase [Candidatus Magasanikbacteria bacterium]|nr:16S rRNA (cytidine(1402)-2'-O)-methyltransferase [Candidatus Magasanikbacteria bacterium]